MTTAEIETGKPEVGNVSDLALFDVNLAQVKSAITLIKDTPAPVDLESRNKLYDVLAAGAKMDKTIDAARLAGTLKLRNRVEAMNAYCKDTLAGPLLALIATRKKEVQAFDAEEEKKRKAEIARLDAEREAERVKAEEAARIIREKAEAEQKRLAEEAKADADADAAHLKGIAKIKALAEAEEKAKVAAAEAAQVAAAAEAKAKIDGAMVRVELQNKAEDLASTKTKGAGKRWAWRIDDINLVPREYLDLVPAKVTNQIREGVREIPGIVIYQEDSLSLR